MAYRFSSRSLRNLRGVDEQLVEAAHYAIRITDIDFGISEGLRTVQRQRELYRKRATRTMNSKHLSGDAIDCMAYVGSRVSWELNLYDDIADAFRQAAEQLDITMRWGGAWTVRDIGAWNGTMQEAMESYIDTRRAQGRRPFIDGPHFELMR